MLGRIQFFQGMPKADIEMLTPFFEQVSYPTDSVIFKQGDSASHLYLIVDGEVVIRYKPEDGPEMTISHIQSGGVFGWSAALGNPTYTSCAVVDRDCSVLRVGGVDLRRVCEQNRRIEQFILSHLTAVISNRWQARQKAQVRSILEQGLCPQEDGKARTEEKVMVKPDSLIQIKALIEQLSAYIEHFHGGSVEFVSFDGKTLKVKLGGACLGCPLSPATLHGWVQGTVRQFFPDIECVEAE